MSGLSRRRFRFIKEIAEGGFGKVYLAEQISADGFSRIVAIKLLHAKWSSHDEVVMRTRDEARLLGLIRHQHIVKVEDLTAIDGKCALIMEYLEGCDLKVLMGHLQEKGEPFPRAALFEIALSASSALDAAYNGIPLQGGKPLQVIHRDIKPSNIFVTISGAAKVLDFGTARADFAEREAKTQALAFGSQGYMAPERMLGEEDTAAADVFSLGVTLYELLALDGFGRIPPRPNKFAAKVEEKIASMPLEGDPEWCDQVRETLRLMMAYEPTERPSAAQLVDIFELLAQNANDTGLRRFCRTTVAEAKATEPELDTGDPLTGRTMEEDLSSSFERQGAGGVPKAASQPPIDKTAKDAFGSAPPPPSGQAHGLGSAPPPPVAAPASALETFYPDDDLPPTVVQAVPDLGESPGPPAAGGISKRDLAAATDDEHQEEEAAGGGGMIKVVVLLFVTLLVLGVVLVAGGAGIGGAVWWTQSVGPAGSVEQAPSEVPDTPDVPEKGSKYDGGTLTSEDTRADVKRATGVTVQLDGADWADITIQGGVGFKAEWDGVEAFELGPLAEGKYRTNITPAGGKKIRGKSFEVEAGKACKITFSVSDQKWTGECS